MAKRTKPHLLDSLFAEARREAQKRVAGEGHLERARHLRALLMPIQALLEADPSRRISVRSPRQTGKSTGVMLIVTIRCLEKAASEWKVIGLTRMSVKGIYWSALKVLNKQFELGISFNNSELTATFGNGSVISFLGADKLDEIEKLRGGRYDGVVIDESKSYSTALFNELVFDVLEPALMAKDGQLFVIGTPGDILDGPFYLATCEEPVVTVTASGEVRLSNAPYGTTPAHKALWSLHVWTLKDNVTRFQGRDGRLYTMWDQALEIKDRNGWADDHPTWRREYLGHWVANFARWVYHYKSYLHDYTPLSDTKWGLPADIADDPGWKTVIGVDFGTVDGTAIVIWAFHPHHEGLWEVYSERRRVQDGALIRDTGARQSKRDAQDTGRRLTVGLVAEWYKELEAEYGPFSGWPADPAGLATMVIDTLADEHGVFLEPAEKKEKVDHIELINEDFDRGRIHVRRGSVLSEEFAAIRWNEKLLAEKGKREEDRSIPNDVADAGLYAWRWALHRRSRPRAGTVQLYSAEWWFAQEEAEFKRVRDEARDRIEGSQLDRKWWD